VKLALTARFMIGIEFRSAKIFFASNNLTLVSTTHSTLDYSSIKGPIIIGNSVWVGTNVTIVGPVNIGDNVIIGAGAVVLKDLQSNGIYAGVPARLIRWRNEAE